MKWDVQLDPEFARWIGGLEEDLRREILAHAALLRERGPQLGRPYVDTIEDSEYLNMKELRVQFRGDPWRILFAFDPNRAAILLVGGNKRGDKRWYKKHIPIADERFKRHLESLER
ncbi:MAG: type II toxin-antitoxin system RelE/ParE family toxin [Isosphaeraceae bacterium]